MSSRPQGYRVRELGRVPDPCGPQPASLGALIQQVSLVGAAVSALSALLSLPWYPPGSARPGGGWLLVSGCGSQCCVTQVAGRTSPCLALHFCGGDEASYLQGSPPVVRKEQCPGSQELNSSPGSAPFAPPSGLQLSRLSNGHGRRWSLSCCPGPIMEFCMNSKEESGRKCIHSTLMGLFFW